MIGLFFGSFNPVHWGHLIIANILYQQYSFKEIIFIPSPASPFKVKHTHQTTSKQLLKHFMHRVNMLELALADWEVGSVCDIEKTLPFPNYTYQTLRQLRKHKKYKQASLIMGEDNFMLLSQWKEYKWIVRHFPICVYNRVIASESAMKNIKSHKAVTRVKPTLLSSEKKISLPLLNFSSREIRSRISKQQSIEHLVPPAVNSYIQAHPLLYKNPL